MTLIEEIVRHLRDRAGGAFGDDNTDEGCKIFADFAPQIEFPYAVIYEVGERYDFMTRGVGTVYYLADGMLHCDIYDDDRARTRQLGVLVAQALTDAEPYLSPDEGRLTMIRPVSAKFVPFLEPGPGGSATVFQRTLIVSYQQQRSL